MRKPLLAALTLGVSVLLSVSSTALGAATIDTTGSWDGKSAACGFGVPDTS